MAQDTIVQREYQAAPPARERPNTSWAWMLLLPLFFIFGWFTNDAINGTTSNVGQDNQPTYGIGGGPGPQFTPLPNSVDTTNNPNETFPPEQIPSATDEVNTEPMLSPSPTSRAQSSPALTATPGIEDSPAP
jgi:hypothetical protein